MKVTTTTLNTSGTAAREPITLVTGAGGGLGQYLCWHLIRHKHRVVATDLNEGALGSLKDEAQALCFALDASSESNWAQVLSATQNRWGPVTGAALCAGGWAGGKAFYETDPATWQRMMSLNLDSARVGMHVLLRHMIHHGSGSVVAVGSRAVQRPWESTGAAAYAASKAALVSLVGTAAAELSDTAVRINVVLPSTIDTPANRAAMPKADPSKWVSTTELSNVITFLLSPDSSGVTGAAIPVYGRA